MATNNKSDTESEEEDNVQVNIDLPNEQWLPIPDEPFNKTFSVSNMGRVKNIKTGKIKTLTKNKSTGYYSVRLDIGKKHKKKTYQIHQLIAQMFIGNSPENYYVTHIDRNKQNNKVDNLKYISISESTKNTLEKKREELLNKSNTSDTKIINKTEVDKFKEIPGYLKYLIDQQGNIYNKNTKEQLSPDRKSVV